MKILDYRLPLDRFFCNTEHIYTCQNLCEYIVLTWEATLLQSWLFVGVDLFSFQVFAFEKRPSKIFFFGFEFQNGKNRERLKKKKRICCYRNDRERFLVWETSVIECTTNHEALHNERSSYRRQKYNHFRGARDRIVSESSSVSSMQRYCDTYCDTPKNRKR